MMNYTDMLIDHYGWQGVALAAIAVILFAVQLYYYAWIYRCIPRYRLNARQKRIETLPPVSVIIPMFSENYPYIEEQLPLLLNQDHPEFEVVVVYVGNDNDFFEDLLRLRKNIPSFSVTKIEQNPRFLISVKQALNVGIKSARYEHLIFSTTDASPADEHWLTLMARGFMHCEIVLGYCGLETGKGWPRYFMRVWQMMHAADWLSAAVRRRPYRGIRHNLGLTKQVYFRANGFNCLNMNTGEDDLFMQAVMTPDNVGLVLSPRATLREKLWGGYFAWFSSLRYYGSAAVRYPLGVRNFLCWERGSRVLFFLTVLCALVCMPWEYKLAAAALLLLRYAAAASAAAAVGRRVGETGVWPRYFFYDLLSPLHDAALRLSLALRRDDRVWR